jgi:hypothetical protein
MERMDAPPDTTLREAKVWLGQHLAEGAICPACTQHAKVYRRKINSTMARALIQMYLHGAAERFVHVPSLPGDTHEISQASWWDLVEEERIRRPDGGRAGFWSLTVFGRMFVLGEVSVPEYALIYDGSLVRTEGDPRTISDCLGVRFNYDELMGR